MQTAKTTKCPQCKAESHDANGDFCVCSKLPAKTAKTKLTYEQFAETYSVWLNDRSKPYAEREQAWTLLETSYPKYHAKYNLTHGFGALQPGDTVLCVVNSRSRSGLSRKISFYKIETDRKYLSDSQQWCLAWLNYNIAKLMGYSLTHESIDHGIRCDNGAREMVCFLSQKLFGIDQSSALRAEVI
jgi:hypothetical protein